MSTSTTDTRASDSLTFTLFPKLPIEIRLIVWALVSPPRFIKIYSAPWEVDDFIIDSKTPNISQISQESRTVFLEQYNLLVPTSWCLGDEDSTPVRSRVYNSAGVLYEPPAAFMLSTGVVRIPLIKPVYINFSVDTVLSTSNSSLSTFIGQVQLQSEKGFPHVHACEKVKHLAFLGRFASSTPTTLLALASFEALETLSLARQATSSIFQTYGAFEGKIISSIKFSTHEYASYSGLPNVDIRFIEMSEVHSLMGNKRNLDIVY
ncbi:hypothetical protein BDZ45DRAFT_805428 [Acephala macrosclerotiorum]|nr:hypothetical protein BDZ45DRAFT_805428 [Acephala macrosclerotiorum]